MAGAAGKSNESSESLLARHVKGEPDAYELLCGRYEKEVARFVRGRFRTYTPFVIQQVDFILLDTWSEVWRSAKSFKGKSSVWTWICAIAKNVYKKKRRDALYGRHKQALGTAEEADAFFDEVEDQRPGVVEQATGQDFNRDLERALLKLTPDQWLAFDLRQRKELELSEVAELMQVDESTVRYHLNNALDRLRDLLSRHDPKRSQGE